MYLGVRQLNRIPCNAPDPIDGHMAHPVQQFQLAVGVFPLTRHLAWRGRVKGIRPNRHPIVRIYPTNSISFTRRANQLRFTEIVSSPRIKNNSLPLFRNTCYIPTVSSSPRGAYRDRHGRWDGMRWTRCAHGERADCVRRRRVVLTSRCWRQRTWRQLPLRAQRRQKSRSPGRARYKP
jgi:hypothetical protein